MDASVYNLCILATTPRFRCRQTADVQNEVGTPRDARQFVAGALDISIGQPKSLAVLPQNEDLAALISSELGASPRAHTIELPHC